MPIGDHSISMENNTEQTVLEELTKNNSEVSDPAELKEPTSTDSEEISETVGLEEPTQQKHQGWFNLVTTVAIQGCLVCMMIVVIWKLLGGHKFKFTLVHGNDTFSVKIRNHW